MTIFELNFLVKTSYHILAIKCDQVENFFVPISVQYFKRLKIDYLKKNQFFLIINIIKQVRTNIGLADTLIPSSFIYLIYMGGTGSCDSIKIIFGYHVNS